MPLWLRDPLTPPSHDRRPLYRHTISALLMHTDPSALLSRARWKLKALSGHSHKRLESNRLCQVITASDSVRQIHNCAAKYDRHQAQQ